MSNSFNLSDWFKPAVSTISFTSGLELQELMVWNKTVQFHWNHIEGQRCPEDPRLHAFGLLPVNRICVYAQNLSVDVRLCMYMEIQRQSWWWSIWGHLASSWFLSFMSSPGRPILVFLFSLVSSIVSLIAFKPKSLEAKQNNAFFHCEHTSQLPVIFSIRCCHEMPFHLVL